MDSSRQPPNSFSRPQDRPLIHNPNHQSSSAGQQQPYFGAPASQQPPVQIPFSDPFTSQRRDPFMPASSQRRDVFGLHGREAVGALHNDRPPLSGSWANAPGNPTAAQHPQHPQSAPAPPAPPLSSAHAPPTSNSYAFDSGRRRSLGGASPPRYYASEPPPPPPSFGNRHMPPPSPSQQPLQPPSYGARGPPTNPFSSGRDLPGLAAGHRPGSGMSISSLLGGDSSAPPPGPSHHAPTNTTTTPSPSVSASAMQPPSPRRSSGFGYGQWRRPTTPDRQSTSSGLRGHESSAYAANSPPRYFGSSRGSPEQTRNVPLQHQPQPQYRPMAAQDSRQYQSSPNATLERDTQRMGHNGVPPRPNSQPIGFAPPPPPPREREIRDSNDASVHRRPIYDPAGIDRRPVLEEQHQRGFTGQEPHMTSHSAAQERASTVQPLAQSAFSPPQESRPPHGPYDAFQPVNRGMYGRDPIREDISRDYNPSRREEAGGLLRTGFRNQTPSHSTLSTGGGDADIGHRYSFGVEPVSRVESQHATSSLDLAHTGSRLVDRVPVGTPPDVHHYDRRRADAIPGGVDFPPRSIPHDYQPRGQIEEMQRQRSYLGISPEGNRRPGRASPLPQAVQGAQAQLVGPGDDPRVKSEFSRMFSGLGSGLGSVPPREGTSTPSRQSPLPQRHRESLGDTSQGGDADGLKMTRIGSSRGAKGRRMKDEDGRLDSESGDGRSTPLGGARGGKRTKLSHPAHPHHHHPSNHHHHHHHHHHIPDDANLSATQANGTNLGGKGGLGSGKGGLGSTHHHHHHHAPHHHHHGAKSSVTPNIPPARKPTRTVISQPLINSVSHLPREHLGSELYTAKVTLPPSSSTPLGAKYGYHSQPRLMPRFDGKENCTFTIRVPRYYLTPTQREQICQVKNVFGTEVYTDDSDPIAAAIHSGWIRGEWGEDVDVTLLDGVSTTHTEDVPQTMTAPQASGPIVPPPGMDLHIKILILPPLEKYTESVQHGLSSRTWGGHHDGVSFMIHKLEWVDEGASRGEERTGEARRQRLKAAMTLMSLFSGEGDVGTTESVGNGAGRMAQAVA